jgi:PatG Domain
MTTSAYVYALGRIEPRFPRLSVEKEYAQAAGRAETAGLPTDKLFKPFCPSQRIVIWRVSSVMF